MLYAHFLLGLLSGTVIAASGTPAHAPIVTLNAPVPEVPFFSQIKDIHSAKWKNIGCGIASLAMIIDYYYPGSVSVNTLLKEGIASGAYIKDVGWKHLSLARLARPYGLEGMNYDLSSLGKADAFARFKEFLDKGPLIASVYYKFDPKSPIPHLVVINGIEGNRVYYNDPAGLAGGKEISVADFMKGWKKRFIVVRPAQKSASTP
ncbi:MAG: C39 family peptidase [bacterium]|nr:C39 family peptidase [bacterium]